MQAREERDREASLDGKRQLSDEELGAATGALGWDDMWVADDWQKMLGIGNHDPSTRCDGTGDYCY